jgi:hypothetical protein
MLNLTPYKNKQVSDLQLWNMLQPYALINTNRFQCHFCIRDEDEKTLHLTKDIYTCMNLL